MEDRIAALENAVAKLQMCLAESNARYFCLKRSFMGTCGRLAVSMLEDLREGKEECSVSALWLTIPGVTAAQSDHLSDVIRYEFDDLYAGVIAVAEEHKATSPAEPLYRSEALVNLISASGVHLSDTQRSKLASILHRTTAQIANSQAASELSSVLILTDVHGECLNNPESKQQFQSLSEIIRQRIRDLNPKDPLRQS